MGGFVGYRLIGCVGKEGVDERRADLASPSCVHATFAYLQDFESEKELILSTGLAVLRTSSLSHQSLSSPLESSAELTDKTHYRMGAEE